MSPDDHVKARKLPLFRSMGDKQFKIVMRAGYLQSFPSHVDLFAEGQSADFLYVLVEGLVELFSRSNDRESTITVVRPATAFILSAVIKEADYLMSARTLERSQLLMLPASNIRETFKRDRDFSRAIAVELASGYSSIVKAFMDVKLHTAVERLANYLLQYNREYDSKEFLQLAYDKRTLASELTMTPEYLSRAFNTLKPYGVEVDGANVRLTDIGALRELVKPNQLIDG
jgi:CRP/FNR family transcriptional activator FtrB